MHEWRQQDPCFLGKETVSKSAAIDKMYLKLDKDLLVCGAPIPPPPIASGTHSIWCMLSLVPGWCRSSHQYPKMLWHYKVVYGTFAIANTGVFAYNLLPCPEFFQRGKGATCTLC